MSATKIETGNVLLTVPRERVKEIARGLPPGPYRPRPLARFVAELELPNLLVEGATQEILEAWFVECEHGCTGERGCTDCPPDRGAVKARVRVTMPGAEPATDEEVRLRNALAAEKELVQRTQQWADKHRGRADRLEERLAEVERFPIALAERIEELREAFEGLREVQGEPLGADAPTEARGRLYCAVHDLLLADGEPMKADEDGSTAPEPEGEDAADRPILVWQWGDHDSAIGPRLKAQSESLLAFAEEHGYTLVAVGPETEDLVLEGCSLLKGAGEGRAAEVADILDLSVVKEQWESLCEALAEEAEDDEAGDTDDR